MGQEEFIQYYVCTNETTVMVAACVSTSVPRIVLKWLQEWNKRGPARCLYHNQKLCHVSLYGGRCVFFTISA